MLLNLKSKKSKKTMEFLNCFILLTFAWITMICFAYDQEANDCSKPILMDYFFNASNTLIKDSSSLITPAIDMQNILNNTSEALKQLCLVNNSAMELFKTEYASKLAKDCNLDEKQVIDEAEKLEKIICLKEKNKFCLDESNEKLLKFLELENNSVVNKSTSDYYCSNCFTSQAVLFEKIFEYVLPASNETIQDNIDSAIQEEEVGNFEESDETFDQSFNETSTIPLIVTPEMATKIKNLKGSIQDLCGSNIKAESNSANAFTHTSSPGIFLSTTLIMFLL
jgi:hypothetical protein